MTRLLMIIVGAVVAGMMLLCLGLLALIGLAALAEPTVSDFDAAPVEVPHSAGPYTVTYRVNSGDEDGLVDVTYTNATGGDNNLVVEVPWEKRVNLPEDIGTAWLNVSPASSESMYIEPEDTVKCEILVGGQTEDQRRASGDYPIVSCSAALFMR